MMKPDAVPSVVSRSNKAEVRNPVLSLPAFKELAKLPEDQRQAMRALYRDMAADARTKADKCWRTHKAPMAAYWKAVSVYAGHIGRALR